MRKRPKKYLEKVISKTGLLYIENDSNRLHLPVINNKDILVKSLKQIGRLFRKLAFFNPKRWTFTLFVDNDLLFYLAKKIYANQRLNSQIKIINNVNHLHKRKRQIVFLFDCQNDFISSNLYKRIAIDKSIKLIINFTKQIEYFKNNNGIFNIFLDVSDIKKYIFALLFLKKGLYRYETTKIQKTNKNKKSIKNTNKNFRVQQTKMESNKTNFKKNFRSKRKKKK